ncbi:hypothetical protein P152DRAFT_14316 [Eremomyces bilateralis CBS 781.70]|uniref:Uncharacterized protein n=1 Tax=Eremomyces bilateralis CBS 781.70 TaxID=1392243 RepID=A0A6G1GHD5_9PEZI|nr:uncharacterized protein P152DRAFT_14316 [Eremomyces bilateralis CBS 781.70]KAF1817280.1 hypothetical protein P152DRAFT_14316 [Eremomyces bilateralis CBS 781.70]
MKVDSERMCRETKVQRAESKRNEAASTTVEQNPVFRSCGLVGLSPLCRSSSLLTTSDSHRVVLHLTREEARLGICPTLQGLTVDSHHASLAVDNCRDRSDASQLTRALTGAGLGAALQRNERGGWSWSSSGTCSTLGRVLRCGETGKNKRFGRVRARLHASALCKPHSVRSNSLY